MSKKDKKNKYKDLILKINEILFRNDPINLIAGGAPEDEYSPEASAIAPKLKDCNNENDVLNAVYEVFCKYFNTTYRFEKGNPVLVVKKVKDNYAGDRDSYKEIAKEIWCLIDDRLSI